MHYRSVGVSGLTVSEIGFGTWGIGGNVNRAIAYGPTDDRESIKALRSAFELGVTFYDTAPLYGYGHSEDLIGDTFREVRQKVVIASKVGFLDQDGRQDFRPAHIRESLEETLRRLRSDYLDLYQLHDPPVSLLQENSSILETMNSLRDEGKIRDFALSARNPNDALVAIRELGFRIVSLNFNLVDQRAIEIDLFDVCESLNASVIGRTPLCFGFLTGKYSAQTQFDESDHRRRWSVTQIEQWASAYQLFRSAVRLKEQSDAQIALRYCLSYKQISTVIPGMLHPSEVAENVQASDLGPLSEAERREIESIYRQHNFFLGKGYLAGKAQVNQRSNDN